MEGCVGLLTHVFGDRNEGFAASDVRIPHLLSSPDEGWDLVMETTLQG